MIYIDCGGGGERGAEDQTEYNQPESGIVLKIENTWTAVYVRECV